MCNDRLTSDLRIASNVEIGEELSREQSLKQDGVELSSQGGPVLKRQICSHHLGGSSLEAMAFEKVHDTLGDAVDWKNLLRELIFQLLALRDLLLLVSCHGRDSVDTLRVNLPLVQRIQHLFRVLEKAKSSL